MDILLLLVLIAAMAFNLLGWWAAYRLGRKHERSYCSEAAHALLRSVKEDHPFSMNIQPTSFSGGKRPVLKAVPAYIRNDAATYAEGDGHRAGWWGSGDLPKDDTQ